MKGIGQSNFAIQKNLHHDKNRRRNFKCNKRSSYRIRLQSKIERGYYFFNDIEITFDKDCPVTEASKITKLVIKATKPYKDYTVELAKELMG